MKTNEFVKKYDRIFIDLSSIIGLNGKILLDELSKLDVLDFNGANHLIISNETLLKVQELQNKTKRQEILQVLKKMQINKTLQFKFFNNLTYPVIFEKFISRYSLALISNDENICNSFNNFKFTKDAKKFGIYSFNKDLKFSHYSLSSATEKSEKRIVTEKNNEETKTKTISYVDNNSSIIHSNFNFSVTEDLNKKNKKKSDGFSLKFLINPIRFKGIEKHDIKLDNQIPKIGDTLLSDNNDSIILTSILSSKGGEGIVYHTNIPGYVCKIYRPHALTSHKFEKLKLLVSKPLNDSRVAYPKNIVYYNGKFVGYIMPLVKGAFVGNFFLGLLSARQYKNWSRADLITLCISIIELVQLVHNHGILIGDVNRNNFMVESPTKVYLVDVDSAQVEKYPCPVGIEEFTPPELLDNKTTYKEFFRTYKNEYYSISVLLFMLLTLGAHPTAQIIHTSVDGYRASLSKIEKIKRQKFAFTLSEIETKNKQNVVNFSLWSRFPSYIKEAFFNTFHISGKFNEPKSRLDPIKWLSLLKSYRLHISRGYLGSDEDVNSLITKNPIAFSSVVLKPSSVINFELYDYKLEDLIQKLTIKLNEFKVENIKSIQNQMLISGEINSSLLKLKVTTNLGFMYSLKGTINMEGGI